MSASRDEVIEPVPPSKSTCIGTYGGIFLSHDTQPGHKRPFDVYHRGLLLLAVSPEDVMMQPSPPGEVLYVDVRMCPALDVSTASGSGPANHPDIQSIELRIARI